MRVMESQGYEPFRCQLKYAWPPARPKGDISQHIEDLRTDILPEQDEKEVEFERIPGNARCYCIVFNQGTSNAQAGDLFVLKVNETEAKLDTIQCKNCKAAGDKEKWWNSLGVAIDTEDTQPVEGSAGYSYRGLEAFCKLVSRRLEMNVQIDSRILAVSFECPDTFQLPKNKKLRWWFREMFEPTISVLPPSGENDADEEDEEDDEDEAVQTSTAADGNYSGGNDDDGWGMMRNQLIAQALKDKAEQVAFGGSWRRAARAIEEQPDPIFSGKHAMSVKGIGRKIAKEIDSILATLSAQDDGLRG